MTHREETEDLPSASAMPRIVHCHGSVQFARDEPESPSDEARQGSDIAKALELMDLEGLEEDSKTITLRLKQMEERAVAEWVKDNTYRAQKLCDTHFVCREERLWIRDRVTKAKIASAKPDVYYICEGSALVLNHKTGYLPIPPAAINFQIRTEALALWHEYPQLRLIRACTAHYRFREAFSACDYTLDHLRQAEMELLFHLKHAQQPDAPRVPSIHCRYCPALHSCPEAATAAMITTVHTGPQPLKKQEAIAVAYKLDLTQLAYAHRLKSTLNNFMEAVATRLHRCSDEELASVGLRRVPSGNIRVVPDIQKLWAVIHASGLMNDAEFRDCLEPVLGRLEAALVAKITKSTHVPDSVAHAAVQRILDPAIELKPKNPMLKPLKALPEGE